MSTGMDGDVESSTIEGAYRSLYSRCVAVARGVVGNGSAEDVAQEAFVRLLEYRCDRDRLSASYVFRVVRNVALNMKFDLRRRPVASEGAAEVARQSPPGCDDLHASWVHDVIADLGPTQHAAITLTEARGLTEHQAGLAVGLARTTIGAAKRSVIESLRDRAVLRDGATSRRASKASPLTTCA
ncbi:hypothetical protein PHYC_00076 [Phycisphaerales bacterium]|nr:hypothetical protein PHYC_00076 [Phycisphaerales bacterium]